MSIAEAARPATATESVAAALRRAIVDRDLKPGDRIGQEEVARRLGVSPIPVREALKVLEGEGQVVYRPRQGYFVAALDATGVAEVYRLRELLEAEAVRAAVPRLDGERVDAIDESFAEADAALADGRVGAAIAANRRAHFILLEASEMPVLVRHVRMLWDSTEAYRALYYDAAPRRKSVARDHRAIVAALRARDAERAVELLARHRARALDALTPLLGR